ncbi:MAG TPA: Rieske (2Fe-2S) protein [Micromonospora sp.]
MSDNRDVLGPHATSRRTLLLGAGAVGATVALSGCGTSSGNDLGNRGAADGGATSSAGQSTGGSTSSAGQGSAGSVLAKTTEIPVGGGKIFAEQGVVVTQPTAGQFKAFSNVCTHQGCPVSSVNGNSIVCTCHNSTFSIADGSVTGGPARSPLPEKQISVEGENIVLA